jgi:hypothetical protein
MGREYCAYCERVGCDGDCIERRLDVLYDSAVELMIPHATTDVLGELKRLRRHIDRGIGPANGHPFHRQFIDALIDEAMVRTEKANADSTESEES